MLVLYFLIIYYCHMHEKEILSTNLDTFHEHWVRPFIVITSIIHHKWLDCLPSSFTKNIPLKIAFCKGTTSYINNDHKPSQINPNLNHPLWLLWMFVVRILWYLNEYIAQMFVSLLLMSYPEKVPMFPLCPFPLVQHSAWQGHGQVLFPFMQKWLSYPFFYPIVYKIT